MWTVFSATGLCQDLTKVYQNEDAWKTALDDPEQFEKDYKQFWATVQEKDNDEVRKEIAKFLIELPDPKQYEDIRVFFLEPVLSTYAENNISSNEVLYAGDLEIIFALLRFGPCNGTETNGNKGVRAKRELPFDKHLDKLLPSLIKEYITNNQNPFEPGNEAQRWIKTLRLALLVASKDSGCGDRLKKVGKTMSEILFEKFDDYCREIFNINVASKSATAVEKPQEGDNTWSKLFSSFEKNNIVSYFNSIFIVHTSDFTCDSRRYVSSNEPCNWRLFEF